MSFHIYEIWFVMLDLLSTYKKERLQQKWEKLHYMYSSLYRFLFYVEPNLFLSAVTCALLASCFRPEASDWPVSKAPAPSPRIRICVYSVWGSSCGRHLGFCSAAKSRPG